MALTRHRVLLYDRSTMSARIQSEGTAARDLRTEDHFSLPGWIYWDPEFFELEKQVVFRKSWHLVGHVNDVPVSGDYLTFKFLNESILTVRGSDGRVRSFHNVCRHRAARLVGGEQGNCGKRITCPYHAWTYATDGRLVGVPLRANYPGLNPDHYGLAEVEQEIWRGFVFVRFAPGLPSVADQMAPYAAARADPPSQLEERRGQLLRRAAHPRGAPGTNAHLRQELRHRGARLGGQDVRPARGAAVAVRVRAHVPEADPRHGARRERVLGVLQALAERGDRAVPGPD